MTRSGTILVLLICNLAITCITLAIVASDQTAAPPQPITWLAPTSD